MSITKEEIISCDMFKEAIMQMQDELGGEESAIDVCNECNKLAESLIDDKIPNEFTLDFTIMLFAIYVRVRKETDMKMDEFIKYFNPKETDIEAKITMFIAESIIARYKILNVISNSI